ncbi:toll/interleukin-1 receptor domain-containing protein [Streptomyces carpaticus]|uniref:toll/interleukin-1 receptor domain-containing protein n=1 Tax=Streptomyces carpaticus TaxID=285558 RepID=UPI0022095A3D|nr:toll/interleukin-1 receptor domain-containing protein [Streptomyces carpaticus]
MPTSPEVFINYRTGDEEMAAVHIQSELARRFGLDRVFYASRSIQAGQDYAKRLEDAIRRCRILLAIIGPKWAAFPSRTGGRALDSEDDWTRREILQAHEYGIPVIPVLISRGMTRLVETELPDELAFLAKAQYVRFEHRSQVDLDHIVDEILQYVPELTAQEGHETDGKEASLTPQPGPISNSVSGRVGTSHQLSDVTGGVHTDNSRVTHNSPNSGTVINQPSGSVHTGSGAMISGDVRGTGLNFGSGQVNVGAPRHDGDAPESDR